MVYDIAARSVKYMSPSVDFDTMPLWLADSKHLIFTRRPGLPFGQQAQQGTGAMGLPNGPAFQAPGAGAAPAQGGRGARGAGRGNQAAANYGAIHPCGRQQLARPDARHVQRRLYAVVLQGRCHHRRG
ncbi:MAG: hypothetical protein WDO73_07270 [Ignavibacteriota bacterium]